MASISNWNKHRDKERNTERHLVFEKHENTNGSLGRLFVFIHLFMNSGFRRPNKLHVPFTDLNRQF